MKTLLIPRSQTGTGARILATRSHGWMLMVCCMVLLVLVPEEARGQYGSQTCWKDTYGRNVGTIPTECPAGTEKDGLLCYPKCRGGFDGVGPVCWEECPAGYRDDGAFCAKPEPYGRGAGFGYWPIFENINHARQRCESEHGRGNCERSLEMYYPRCKPGYHPVGCCVCSPDCPAGMADIGVSCTKGSYGRTAGQPMQCASGLVNDAGLCYEPCRRGTHGVGPVCWGECPSDYPFNCGAACAVSESACAFSIIKQVQSTGELALNVGMLVTTAGAGNAALKAAQTSAKAVGKTILSQTARQAAKKTFKQKLKQSAARRNLDRVDRVLGDAALLETVAEAAVTAKEEGEFDWEVLYSMEDFDPTGVLAVVNAFNQPICGDDPVVEPMPPPPPPPPPSRSSGYVQGKVNPAKCLHKRDGGWYNGNPIHVWDCNAGPAENKTWAYDAATGYIRGSENPAMCLHKRDGGWRNGNPIHVWDCNAGPAENKTWLYDAASGMIRGRTNPAMCLHKREGGWRNGNPIHVWDCNAGPAENKTWTLK